MNSNKFMEPGSSKQRRDQLKAEIIKLGALLPFDYGKRTQLSNLKASSVFLRKEKYLGNVRNEESLQYLRPTSSTEYSLIESMAGFVVCFSSAGQLIYLSENVLNFLDLKSMEILLTHDKIMDLAPYEERATFERLLTDARFYEANKSFSFMTMLSASAAKTAAKRQTNGGKRLLLSSSYKPVKISGYFDQRTNMFMAVCTPMLTAQNCDQLASHGTCFKSTHSMDLQFVDLCANGQTLLGYNKSAVKQYNLYDLVHSTEGLKCARDKHVQVLGAKSTKAALVERIELIKSDGGVMRCLFTMHCNANLNRIVCVYQVINEQDYALYEDFTRRTLLTMSAPSSKSSRLSVKSEDDYSEDDESEEEEEEDELTSPSSSSNKRRKTTHHYEDDSRSYSPKHFKQEPVEVPSWQQEPAFTFQQPSSDFNELQYIENQVRAENSAVFEEILKEFQESFLQQQQQHEIKPDSCLTTHAEPNTSTCFTDCSSANTYYSSSCSSPEEAYNAALAFTYDHDSCQQVAHHQQQQHHHSLDMDFMVMFAGMC